MTRTIRVDVTADDIRLGRPEQCRFCPVARAVNRALGLDPELGLILVGRTIYYNGMVQWSVRAHPEVVEFEDRFDIGLPVAPFSFDLTIPG